MLRTTISPTMLSAGNKINVIPNTAEAQLDVRRLPNETHAEIFERVRRVVHDPAVEVRAAPGQEMPATEPSGISTPLYEAMHKTFARLPEQQPIASSNRRTMRYLPPKVFLGSTNTP